MSAHDGAFMPYVDVGTGEVFLLPPVGAHKRPKKRPLGRLESDGRFTPRQPVLSSRTLDIDKSGSRTYRAKSTSAIIEEQHQLLHDVYVSNRNTKNAEPARGTAQTQTTGQQQGDPKRRRFLTINGKSPQRPWTSVERPTSVKKSDGQKKRPHTTVGRGRSSAVQAVTDTHLHLVEDRSLQASSKALQRAQQQVRDLWRPENHCLEDGTFVRGRSDLGAGDGRAGSWLNFSGGGGGGDDDDNSDAGLVHAFTTAMRGRGGEFYTIDGTVGTHIARQLRRGDKVRVGINGRVQSTTLRVKRWRKDAPGHSASCIEEVPSEEEILQEDRAEFTDQRPPPIPLCWADQVHLSEKVLEARTRNKPTPKKSLCESRPVIFDRLLPDDALGRHLSALRGASSAAPTAGFAVRTRTKARVGIDGSTTQNMTSLSISADTQDEADNMSLEDVLERQLQGRDPKPSERKRPDLAIPNLSDLLAHDGKTTSKARALRTPPTSARSAKPEVPSPPPSRAAVGTPWSMTGGDARSVRPLTAHSAHSIDQNFDSFVVTSSNSISGGKPGSARSGGRATSGKRPPPAKPMLHRSAAAMGASIGGGGNSGKADTSYIQITQSLTSPLQPEQQPRVAEDGPQGIPPPTPASLDGLSMEGASLVEQDLNPDEFPELESDVDDADVAMEDPDYSDGEFPPEGANDPPHMTAEEPANPSTSEEQGEVVEEDAGEAERGVDVCYAFNIPTASELDDEEEDPGAANPDRQSLHDRLVEQTADLLAGAIIGADLPADLGRLPSATR